MCFLNPRIQFYLKKFLYCKNFLKLILNKWESLIENKCGKF